MDIIGVFQIILIFIIIAIILFFDYRINKLEEEIKMLRRINNINEKNKI